MSQSIKNANLSLDNPPHLNKAPFQKFSVQGPVFLIQANTYCITSTVFCVEGRGCINLARYCVA